MSTSSRQTLEPAPARDRQLWTASDKCSASIRIKQQGMLYNVGFFVLNILTKQVGTAAATRGPLG